MVASTREHAAYHVYCPERACVHLTTVLPVVSIERTLCLAWSLVYASTYMLPFLEDSMKLNGWGSL